jgi:hypothetical protein
MYLVASYATVPVDLWGGVIDASLLASVINVIVGRVS